MTIRFRAAEAGELVDDERAAQRICMGSAMTMDSGEFVSFYRASPNSQPHAAACSLPPTPASERLPQAALSSPIPILQPASFSLLFLCLCRLAVRNCRFLLPLQSAPPRCLKRAFLFGISLASYDSINKTPAPGCSVTLGIGLSFHVRDRPCTRASCAPHTPAASFSLCIESPAGVRGPLLTCRSRNAAPTATSAAQRLRSCLGFRVPRPIFGTCTSCVLQQQRHGRAVATGHFAGATVARSLRLQHNHGQHTRSSLRP